MGWYSLKRCCQPCYFRTISFSNRSSNIYSCITFLLLSLSDDAANFSKKNRQGYRVFIWIVNVFKRKTISKWHKVLHWCLVSSKVIAFMVICVVYFCVFEALKFNATVLASFCGTWLISYATFQLKTMPPKQAICTFIGIKVISSHYIHHSWGFHVFESEMVSTIH